MSGAEKGIKELVHARVFLGICCKSERFLQYLPSVFWIFWRLGSEKLANIVSFKGFEHVLASFFIASSIFFAGTAFEDMIHFKDCSTCRLTMLKCTRKSVMSIASTKWNRNTWFTSSLAFNAAALAETCSLIGGYENERIKNGKEGNRRGK